MGNSTETDVTHNQSEHDILTTNPTVHSFLMKFFFCLSPLLISILAILLKTYLRGILPAFIPDQSILLLSPICLFIGLVLVGWVLYIREIWMGSLAVLILSGISAWFLMTGISLLSLSYIPHFIELWAFYVLIFSIIVSTVMAFLTEKYRQTIQYTITKRGIKIKGGLWKQEEHLILFNQVGRIVMEQGVLGRIFNFGDIIPVSSAQWGAEIGIRGMGASNQKKNFSLGVGYARARQEIARTPVNCLYGVPNPKQIQELLETSISRAMVQQEEQTQYLKEINEKISR